MPRVAVLVLAAAIAGAGCGDGKGSADAEREQVTAAAEGAFCQEHGVLEAVCTKCNPALIPVFQAKGDWCPEHGFPESFCPICHPERGGRPAADVSGDGAPADGTTIRFKTKDTGALAGIETVAAEARPGGARLEAAATVVYDATRHARVNARAAGVIKRLAVDVGSSVEEGSPMATIDSATVGADRSQLRAAATRVEVAEAAYQREKALEEKGIAAKKDVLEARRDLENARAELGAARASLGMVGTGGGNAGSYVLRAPLAGTVTERAATVGHMVTTDEALFEVVDTSKVWVIIDVPEESVSSVVAGQQATIVLDALPEREWTGDIDYVAPAVDVRTRTATARLALDNPEGLLRANMYGQAFIELGAARPTVMVPREAVQRAGGAALVFVKKAEDLYETRRVKVGRSEGAQIEILDGIEPGEQVATTGSFLLKTETLKGSIGAGCCEVE